MNYDSEIKVLMRDKDGLRNDNEALRNKVAVLEHDLAEHNRTAAIVAGGMKRLADERDELRQLSDEAVQIVSDIFFHNATGFSIGSFSSLGKRITAVIDKYRALDAAKAKV